MAGARATVFEGFNVTVIEAQATYGGVWNYKKDGTMYQHLTTNIPTSLMEFEGFHFPENTPKFCDRSVVFEYIKRYSESINANTLFNTLVTEISKDFAKNSWKVSYMSNGVKGHLHADFLLVANGHYSVPNIPRIPGLEEWSKKDPMHVTTARDFDTSAPFKNLKVLVVGNANSGTDIAIQCYEVASSVEVSRRHKQPIDSVLSDAMVLRPEIVRIDPKSGKVDFRDGETGNYDAAIFCTGYKYSLPFLEKFSNAAEFPLIDSEGRQVHNLYKDIFYIGDPTLAFVGLNTHVVPMPIAEAQSSVIGRVWSGNLKLPSKAEMMASSHSVDNGSSEAHIKGFPEDVNYMHDLIDWAGSAGQGGFRAQKWDIEKIQAREYLPESLKDMFLSRIMAIKARKSQK